MNYAGVDVRAQELVVRVGRQERREEPRRFDNTPAGHKALLGYLLGRGREPIRVCLEASGNYSLDVALALAARCEIELEVINPKAARRFAEALDQRSKNDPVDAEVLLEYARRMPFTRWQPPREQDLQLRAITRQLSALTQDRAALRCRLHAATVAHSTPPCVVRELRQAIAQLQRGLVRLTRAAQALVNQDPFLQRRLQLLDSPKGIGQATALAVLGELVVIGDRSPRQLTKHAGLDVVEFSSGTSVHKKPHISHAGNAYLRKAVHVGADGGPSGPVSERLLPPSGGRRETENASLGGGHAQASACHRRHVSPRPAVRRGPVMSAGRSGGPMKKKRGSPHLSREEKKTCLFNRESTGLRLLFHCTQHSACGSMLIS
ncbi:MAG TPA: IS110 family transposase [Terracidiphilus sp.]|nr:IS110 family transposase [Terracidiphilus sp.]